MSGRKLREGRVGNSVFVDNQTEAIGRGAAISAAAFPVAVLFGTAGSAAGSRKYEN